MMDINEYIVDEDCDGDDEDANAVGEDDFKGDDADDDYGHDNWRRWCCC